MLALIKKFCAFSLAFLSLNLIGQTKKEAFDVKITGNGEQNLVFIPGLASSGNVFEETRSEFEADFTIYTLTLAGFAGVPPLEKPSVQKYETAIVDYLRKNNIKNPILIGHSLGGTLTMAIAADYPELPKKIVVVDALPFLTGLSPTNMAKKTDCKKEIAKILSVSDEQFRKMQQKNIQFMVADSSKHDLVLHWSMNSDRKTIAKIYCQLSQMDLREKIGKIGVPTMVLLEPYFKNQSAAIDAQFAKLEPLLLNYAPKGRHFLMYGAKKWYLEQLHEFIDQK